MWSNFWCVHSYSLALTWQLDVLYGMRSLVIVRARYPASALNSVLLLYEVWYIRVVTASEGGGSLDARLSKRAANC
jgi:hypothetical protein